MSDLALTFQDASFTWPEVASRVAHWQRWLASRGVGPGRHVAVSGWNSPDLLFSFFATARLNAQWVPLNARLTEFERAALLARVNPVVFLDAAALGEVGRELACPETVADPPPPLLAEVDPEAGIAGLFTSGTTGVPKWVSLTHAQFVAHGLASTQNLGGARPSDAWLGTLPLFHVGGLAMAHRWATQRTHLVLEPQFDAQRARRWLHSGHISHASFVPTALQRVIDGVEQPFPPSLRALLIGGGPMGAELLTRARGLGLPVLQTYGLTEACSQVTTERPSEADGATAGHPLPGVEVKVVDSEIWVRGPTVCAEAGEWLKTGDVGQLDERGRLTVHARRVDLILSGGENVYPAEVEHVLSSHPAVSEAVVVPRPDATWGQVPVALIVWKARPTPLLAWARTRLAGFKVPKAIASLDAVPRNATGKVERRRLAESLGERTFIEGE